jgi:hypothetical protein
MPVQAFALEKIWIRDVLSKYDLKGGSMERSTYNHCHHLEPKSQGDYGSFLMNLHCFLLKCQLKEGLPILQDTYLVNSPSIPAEHLVMYMDFKFGKKGTVLYDYNTKKQVRDVDGGLIFCDGWWKAPHTLQNFKLAISSLHKSCGNAGAYAGFCPDCLKLSSP